MARERERFPNIPEQIGAIGDLAYNVCWIWHPSARMLYKILSRPVEVWLNNPLLPMEARGTSGMKASLNGVPRMSTPQGWWIEGYNGRNGWVFGDAAGKNGDKADAEAMYDLLKKKVIPLYYRIDNEGIPRGWVKVMKEAIKSVGPVFSTRRMAKEYVKMFYREALDHAH